MTHAPAFMQTVLGSESYRDIVQVLEGLTRLAGRGTIGIELHDAFIEVLADDLVMQQKAHEVIEGLLPDGAPAPDTARSEVRCKDSNSD